MRACYLFSRLAKLLRQTLAPFLPDILASLQPLLVAIAADPLPQSPNGAALARSTSGKGSAAFPGAADDRSAVATLLWSTPHSEMSDEACMLMHLM